MKIISIQSFLCLQCIQNIKDIQYVYLKQVNSLSESLAMKLHGANT